MLHRQGRYQKYLPELYKLLHSGKAASWGIQPGDYILSLGGSPKPKFIEGESGFVISRASQIVVEKQDGTLLELSSAAGPQDYVRLFFSIAMELALLGIGGYALLIKPESRIIRLFYLLNWSMALSILSQFSNEKSMSELVISCFSVWLPYLLVSFYLMFVFRTIHSRFRMLLLAFQGYAVIFSLLIVYFMVTEQNIYGWVTVLLNFTIIATLLLLAGITFAYWRTFERPEKNQLLTLFSGLFLSLLPYTLLYAVPLLVHGDYIVPVKYTLIGLLPFSGAITYLLVARSMLDMRIYLPRLLIHSLYFSVSFLLFVLAARGIPAGMTLLLFAVFALLTWGYQQGLRRYRDKEQQRTEWVERQKQLLSLRLSHKGSSGEEAPAYHEAQDQAAYNRILLEAQQSERIRITYYLHDYLLQNMIFLSRDLEGLHDTGVADQEQVAVWLKCVYDSQRDIRALCDESVSPYHRQGRFEGSLAMAAADDAGERGSQGGACL